MPIREHEQHEACSRICHYLAQQMSDAQHVCEVTGDTELWAAVVELNDAFTAYLENNLRVYTAARAVGITNHQWRGIQNGTA